MKSNRASSDQGANESSTEAWIRAGETSRHRTGRLKGELYSARISLDITPALRGRIKIAAFRRGLTVVQLLRELLEREFPKANVPRETSTRACSDHDGITKTGDEP